MGEREAISLCYLKWDGVASEGVESRAPIRCDSGCFECAVLLCSVLSPFHSLSTDHQLCAAVPKDNPLLLLAMLWSLISTIYAQKRRYNNTLSLYTSNNSPKSSLSPKQLGPTQKGNPNHLLLQRLHFISRTTASSPLSSTPFSPSIAVDRGLSSF